MYEFRFTRTISTREISTTSGPGELYRIAWGGGGCGGGVRRLAAAAGAAGAAGAAAMAASETE